MVYHFVILSDEIEDFRREIDIDAEATFLDLEKAILKSCGYNNDQMPSFFICDSVWNKLKEITMMPMNDDPAAENLTMDTTHLDDVLVEEKANVLFLFDTMCERYLFMQLKSIEKKAHLKEAKVTLSTGKAPVQMMDVDALLNRNMSTDEDMYGEDDYNPDELDADGYQDLESLESSDY